MNEQNLRAQLAAAMVRIEELEKELADLRGKKYKSQDTTATAVPPAVVAEPENPYDPWAPTGDVIFDSLRSYTGQPKKRKSWLNDYK